MDRIDEYDYRENLNNCQIFDSSHFHKLLSRVDDEKENPEKIYDDFSAYFKTFQENPQTLNNFASSILSDIIDLIKKNDAACAKYDLSFRLLRILLNVLTRSSAINFLPKDHMNIEFCLKQLEDLTSKNCTTYVHELLILLASSILIPFELNKLFPSEKEEDHNQIISNIFKFIKNYAFGEDSLAISAIRPLAAIFFTRFDVDGEMYVEFLEMLVENINKSPSNDINLQNKIHILSTLIKRECKDLTYQYLIALFFSVKVKIFIKHKNPYVRKRIYLFMQHLTYNAIQSAKRTIGESHLSICSSNEKQNQSKGYSQALDLSEKVINQMISALDDSDEIVRWTCSKGIARVFHVIPSEHIFCHMEKILSHFNETSSHFGWQGGCFALAEIAQRNLLPSSFLSKTIEVILKACLYEDVVGNHTIGSNVRETSSYAIWSIARSHSRGALDNYTHQMITKLLIVVLFDHLYICRISAASTFQELYGRHGHAVPEAQFILNIIDCLSVRNSTFCYTELALKVFKCESLRESLLNDLICKRVSHHEESIRKNACCLVSLLIDNYDCELVDDIFVRLVRITETIKGTGIKLSGNVMALSYTIDAMFKKNKIKNDLKSSYSPNLIQFITKSLSSFSEKTVSSGYMLLLSLYFSGFNVDVVMIECLKKAYSSLSCSFSNIGELAFKLIEKVFRHVTQYTKDSNLSTINSDPGYKFLSDKFLSSEDLPTILDSPKIIRMVSSIHISFILRNKIEILTCLMTFMTRKPVVAFDDCEVRLETLKCLTIHAIQSSTEDVDLYNSHFSLCLKNFKQHYMCQIISFLCNSMTDYSIVNGRDVGFDIRYFCCSSIFDVMKNYYKCFQNKVEQIIFTEAIDFLIRVISDKNTKMRSSAMENLLKLIELKIEIFSFSSDKKILEIISSNTDLFEKILELMIHRLHHESLILGLLPSLPCVTIFRSNQKEMVSMDFLTFLKSKKIENQYNIQIHHDILDAVVRICERPRFLDGCLMYLFHYLGYNYIIQLAPEKQSQIMHVVKSILKFTLERYPNHVHRMEYVVSCLTNLAKLYQSTSFTYDGVKASIDACLIMITRCCGLDFSHVRVDAAHVLINFLNYRKQSKNRCNKELVAYDALIQQLKFTQWMNDGDANESFAVLEKNIFKLLLVENDLTSDEDLYKLIYPPST